MTSQFGPLLRQMRRQAGMTQESLSERSGVGVRTIRRLERNEPTDPRTGTVRYLADALDLTSQDRRKLLAHVGPSAEVADDAAPPESRAEGGIQHKQAPDPVEDGLPAAQIALAESADQLAQVVSARWQREEEQRRVHDPFPLPVRWQPAPAHLTDHWDNIHRVPPGGTSNPMNLTGDLTEIADVYRRVPSSRLVVLGRAGAGKSVLTLRFTLDFLRSRTSTEPVPVIFSLGSWDPTAITLRDWLIDRLLRDHPGLVAQDHNGSTLAAALVESGRVLPILDGFDEIARGLHRTAVEALNSTRLPFLLTSRPDEYAEAVHTTALTGAAGIELLPLAATDLVNYLPRTARKTIPSDEHDRTGTAWDPVLDELRDHPESAASSNLATTLSTPLMIVLARTVYSDIPDQNPADLLDTTRFPTPEALEDHLLGSFVPTVYRPLPPRSPADGRRNWDPETVQHWLAFLAHHLDERHSSDIEWWRLGGSLRRSRRILTVVLASAFLTTFFTWLCYLPAHLVGIGDGVNATLVEGLLVGPEVGLAFGLVHGIMIIYGRVEFMPSRMQVRFAGRGKGNGGRSLRTYATRWGAGLLGGFVVGLGYGPVSAFSRGLFHGFPPTHGEAIGIALTNTLASGTIFGVAAGTVFLLAAALEAPLDVNSAANPVATLATNRTTVLRQLLVLALMLTFTVAFGGELVVQLLQGSLGPLHWLPDGFAVGAVGGLSGAFSYALAFTAWGQWVVVARVWLPLSGRLPWAMIAFLEDAYQRGVLRQVGAAYQFRHARLQDHLSRSFRTQHLARISSGTPPDSRVPLPAGSQDSPPPQQNNGGA